MGLKAEDDAAMDELLSHSISYRIAVGPQQGRKAFTLQTLLAWTGELEERPVANAADARARKRTGRQQRDRRP